MTSYQALLSDDWSIYFLAACHHSAAEQAQQIADQSNKLLLDVVMNDYFPNEWLFIDSLTDEDLDSESYEDIMASTNCWSLPKSVHCIIRATKNNKVSEFVYRSERHALNKLIKLSDSGYELVVLTKEYCHHITEEPG